MQLVKPAAKKAQLSKEEVLGNLLEHLELKELQKQYLRSRWFEKLVDTRQQAQNTRRWYMRLHITTLVGGVLLPGLIGIQVAGVEHRQLQQGLSVAAFVVAKVVAIAAAAEHFLRYGDRWQDLQRSADSLNAEGWQFTQLAGNYQTYQTHEQAYIAFVNNLEQLIKGEEIACNQITQDESFRSGTSGSTSGSSNGNSSTHETIKTSDTAGN